jgi:glycosyltransferase involved in cell wall biosynthesis
MDEEKKKIAFFTKGDDNFIENIIEQLSIKYETKKIIIRKQEEMNLIDQWMMWADICWFEWCDSLIVYGSKLPIAKERKIICRLHSYEAFTFYPSQVNWNFIDRLIFISGSIQSHVIETFKVNKEITCVIPNGVDMDKWTFNQRNPGLKVAYVGYVNYKKGPMLLLHAFKAIYDKDHRYMFYIAGQFQDTRYSLYLKQMVQEFGLENNLFFEGWQNDLDKWLEDKDYILCSSLLESQNMSVMQAMAKGIKPVVHNFVGAKGIYPEKYVWNTIDEAVGMVTEQNYNSEDYREFIEEQYSLKNQMNKINDMIDRLLTSDKKAVEFSYKNYWNQRLNSNFNIQGVGYFGLGEIYNNLLYQNRMDILESVLNITFDEFPDKRVLELGPGIGIFTGYFHEKGIKDYFAIDIVERAITELNSKYGNYHFKLGDISDCDIYEGRYDLIFAADVLLHITNEELYKKSISNISEHLEENGLCILIDPVSAADVKSGSPHVVIRSREYVNKVLDDNGLELIDMLPVANFMNYPFDREVLGDTGKFALEAFNLISSLFSNPAISNGEKQLVGEYLLYREKQLLYWNNLGLSEKFLIIQKKGSDRKIHFSLKDLLDIDTISDKLKTLDQIINQNQLAHQDLFHNIVERINCLKEGTELQNDTIN